MTLTDDFFRESERVIAQFDKPIDFFRSVNYPDPQGITNRYRRALKDHRLPTPGTISQFEGFIETDPLFECMKLSLDSAVAIRGRSNEKVVERFIREMPDTRRMREGRRNAEWLERIRSWTLYCVWKGTDNAV